jgi:hypothetical protein
MNETRILPSIGYEILFKVEILCVEFVNLSYSYGFYAFPLVFIEYDNYLVVLLIRLDKVLLILAD